MSCRVAMLRMERDGLITLPPPRKGNGNGHNRPRLTSASASTLPFAITAIVDDTLCHKSGPHIFGAAKSSFQGLTGNECW
jgi:hypothetical protein